MKRIVSIFLATVMVLGLTVLPAPEARAAADDGIVTTWTGVDGDLFRYHAHTKGSGVPIIIMPVHFGTGDLAAGGRLQTAGEWAADVILGADAYSDLMAYFDVYIY